MNYPKNLNDALKWDYKFWSTQPVKKLREITYVDGEIEHKNPEEIPTNPGPLLEGFEWTNMDFNNDQDVNEISEFVNKYYVEDKNGTFRLHYSPEMLKWMYKTYNHIAISVKYIVDNKKTIIGFICGKVVKMQINKKQMDMIEINLLCVHPKLRQKRLAPRLIKEITRQFNLKGFYYGIYTSANYLPAPVTTIKYFHRPINIDKMVATGFTRLTNNITIEQIKNAIRIKGKPLDNFVKMESRHVNDAYELFNRYMNKYNYHPIYSLEEFTHIFMDNEFVSSYVLEDKNENLIDFISYYTLKTRVLKNSDTDENGFLNIAYLYYYTCVNTTIYKLLNELVYVVCSNNIDVLTAFDVMENENVLTEHGFEEGSGILHYYLYNWKTKPLKNNQLAIIF